MADYSRDPDDLYGEVVTETIEIKCRRNGSMSVAGDINNLAYALAMLDQAKDAVRRHHMRMKGPHEVGLIIPARDTDKVM